MRPLGRHQKDALAYFLAHRENVGWMGRRYPVPEGRVAPRVIRSLMARALVAVSPQTFVRGVECVYYSLTPYGVGVAEKLSFGTKFAATLPKVAGRRIGE